MKTMKSVFGFASAFRGGDPSLLTIQNQISVVDAKIDKILAAPIKMANQHYETALREIQFGKCDQAQETLDKVIDEAMRAFHYTMENGMSVETFQECLKAIKLQVFAKVLKYSYNPDQKYFQPLNTLSGINKSMIAEELESLVKQCIEASKQIPVNTYVPGAATHKSTIQDTLDQILKLTYPYLSFGFGWTNNSSSARQLTYGGDEDNYRKITVNHNYIPEGEPDHTELDLNILDYETNDYIPVKIWKSSSYVFYRFGRDPAVGHEITTPEMEIEIILKSQNSVEISSSGVASYQRRSSMGRYILVGEHNRAYYYKKEEGKDRFLFKGSNGWWVGKDPNIDDGFLFNWSMSDGVPPQDWKYKWYLTYYDDPHLIAFGS